MYKKVISVINQKGGVGKTTTVINLAAGLTMKGKKILVIDLDPQGNATTGLGLSNTENSELTIYSVLNGNKKISEVIQSTKLENLNLVSSKITDNSINTLASLKTLEEVYFWNSDVSARGVSQLRKALPHAKILH